MMHPGAISGPAKFIRRRRPSPEIALLGLYEISKILNGPARLDQTLGNVVNVLTSFLDMRLGMIVILDGEGEPEIVATAGWASETKGRPIESLPRVVIDRLVATATPVVAEDVAKDPLFARAADLIASRIEGRVSFLGVPIKSDEKVVGTLSIVRAWDDENAGGFDADLSFLKMVANLVGQTVRLHRVLSAERKRFLDERRTLEKALDQQLAETRAPRPKVGGIVGESLPIGKVMETIGVVAKTNTTQVGTFKSTNRGLAGLVSSARIHFYGSPLRRHTSETQFRLVKSRAKARFGELGKTRFARRMGFRS